MCLETPYCGFPGERRTGGGGGSIKTSRCGFSVKIGKGGPLKQYFVDSLENRHMVVYSNTTLWIAWRIEQGGSIETPRCGFPGELRNEGRCL